MVPPNILLRLATTSDSPKGVIPNLPKYIKPLDNWVGDPYLGEIRFNAEDLRCYKYTENGWKEIK